MRNLSPTTEMSVESVIVAITIVREYVFYVFSRFKKKHDFLRFLKWRIKKFLEIFSISLVLSPSKWVHILRSVITVIQFPDPRVWSILSHCWTSTVNDVSSEEEQ